MNNAPAILRGLITYAVVVPLAVFIGYMLTNPLDNSTYAFFGILALIFALPLLLHWHHWLLLLAWNMNVILFFAPGRPGVWLLMVMLSLGLSLLGWTLSRRQQFIRVPQVTWPLICLAAVIFFTAKLTGGFGLRALGSDVYGGRKFVLTLVAILGYFALTARRIPPHKVKLALALFFMGGLSFAVGDLYTFLPSGFGFIFWVFPGNAYALQEGNVSAGLVRLGWAGITSTFIISYLLARYGVRGIFLSGKPWRWVMFFLTLFYSCLGGFRWVFILIFLNCAMQFFLEGLHRTKLLPIFTFLGLAGAVALVILTPFLPSSIQRSLSFLPLQIDATAKWDAQASVDWRVDMWKALMPQVPKYLLLGKGYAITQEDFQMMGLNAFHAIDASQQGLALAGDYHVGWLSVLLTLGIWGMAAFLWFVGAGIWALYCNYRYGDPELHTVNCFLLATFVIRALMFLTVTGTGLQNDLMPLTGFLGLSVCLNGGVRRSARKPVPTRETPYPAGVLAPPRPAFQR
jgi:hypothetical protein